MGLSACAALLLLLCNPISSQEKKISTSVLIINSINVFEKSKLGNDILFAFQDAALELKKEADLNAKKFEDEELELTKKVSLYKVKKRITHHFQQQFKATLVY